MRQNLREMTGRVFNLLGTEAEAVIQPGEIEYQIDLTHKHTVKKRGLYRSSFTAPSVADTRIYTPPRKLVEFNQVDYDERELTRLDPDDIVELGDDLDIESPAWTEDL